MKILLLPLFRMPSGHHKAAEAIIGHLPVAEEQLEIKTIDVLSHFHGGLETAISRVYLQWINRKPSSYSKFYKSFMYTDHPNIWSSLCLWNNYFEWKMEQLINKEQPDLIICTHCYPSKLLNNLKRKHKVHAPVINVYTDFFINSVWGKSDIDYHFVPHREAKEQLMKQFGLQEDRVYVTGIPVHPSLYQKEEMPAEKYILIAGGNSGLGNLTAILTHLSESELFYSYKVLCGNNKKLYEWVSSLNHKSIEAIPYTSCRQQMNRYYEGAAAIITKPGGVTISEVLKKELPIFILECLPGQEELNVDYLNKHHLIYQLDLNQPIEKQLKKYLHNEMEKNKWQRRLSTYQLEKEMDLQKVLLAVLQEEEKERENFALYPESAH
ncbi:UDP-N-acetylglucosamine:LPS N-acetylglucosamine transferase [Bacillus ectoiniformans]|uniref:MGDG synthase family glycosyltransferase n=1 Tax=Bacillus ectoiniformans TaxID=1494429 RepID=UPI00195C2211|nr:UDP-N-acetylglucosamine--LPS N-acetylglucosamine transferase [Bacillus ectoiniformans]MBM7649412.1 UDP-N-acetylglucosamine:LPS N-acetylglucosamine transferase [Bacillus ectoiniformans]